MPSMYKLKSDPVEAEQFIPEQLPWPAGVERGGYEGRNNLPTHYVETAYGPLAIVSGDYVLTSRGQKSVISQKHFSDLYEPA